MTVTALLVSHNGARWLPAVLAALEAQTRVPDRVLAVDTGSEDAGVDLLTRSLGEDALTVVDKRTGYGAAVRSALSRRPATDETEWVWLLHDDSAPAPDALATLLDTARDNPGFAVFGPKLREWPSLRRLLEVGVTISGTGRRETGLERGEYDQGQHDRMREVLAVNTAGMLVRRDVLERLGGFDDALPVFGNDIDFGWRAARAGHRTLVVPDAVVFHAEAAHRGARTAPLASRFRRGERRAALFTLLVNCSLAALPFQVVRLFLGSLVRAFGLVLVRAPGEAWDELLALVATYLRPDRVLRGRIRRRRTATLPAKSVRHLLAPPWLPYRHGLDFVSDVAAAVALQAGEVSERRGRRAEGSETGPVPAEAENLPADTGLLSRLLASPVAAVLGLVTVLALVAARGVLGSGRLSGGGLLPAPDRAGAWWSLYLESWHVLGVGSDLPAAPYLVPLALAGSVLLGSAWLAVDLLFVLTVPLAAWGGHRFFRALGAAWPSSVWGGVAYGLLPVLMGAVNQGRLGTVAAAVVLPWLAHAALFLGPGSSRDRRWRAAWRTALWLAVISAFVPMAWFLALLVGFCAVVSGVLVGGGAWVRPSVWGPVAVAVVAVPVLLLPWSVVALVSGWGPSALLFEAGLPAASLGDGSAGGWELLTGRPSPVSAAPGWISLGVVLAGLAALLRRDTRGRVLGAWLVLVPALVLAAALAGRTFTVPWLGEQVPVYAGFLLLVTHGAAIAAAVFASTGISARFSGSSFGWQQPVALLVVVAAFASPLAGLVWWVGTGFSGPVDRREVTAVPTYMTDAAERAAENGVLVLDEGAGGGLEYTVVRGDGYRLGDDTVSPSASSLAPLTAAVTGLVSSPRPEDVEELSRHGVEYLYLSAPADPDVVGKLDSVSGLTSASATQPGARAWQVEAEPSDRTLVPRGESHRGWLLAAQAVAVLAAAVLAAPTRRVRR